MAVAIMPARKDSMAPLILEALLDEKDIARLTKRSLASVRRDRLKRAGVPFIRIGASVRYSPKAVERFIANLPTFGGGPGTNHRKQVRNDSQSDLLS